MRYDVLPDSPHELVALRPIVADDLAAWYGYLSEPAVFEHTSWDVKSPAELSHYAAGEAPTPSSLLRLAIALRATGELVGTAGFHTVSPQHRSAEMAYDLSPRYWGRGIATAICAALTEWAHEHAGILRVQATTLASNGRSQRVLQRCGFEREGLLRSYRTVRGQPGDFWMYAHLGSPGR
jgi:[ribosomal protein S5]-alanine N-acetyltransferase